MSEFEIRMLKATEIRATGGKNEPLVIAGYASIFNSLTALPSFREQIKPGAFTRAINQKQDVVCLFNHDANHVLGRTSASTLRLKQDDKGLFYECELPETRTAQELHESIRRGDINGCSFAFAVPEGGQDWSEQRDSDGTFFIQRDIRDLDLKDVSPVTHPAYYGTSVSARTVEAPVELRSAVDLKNGVTDEQRALNAQANERWRQAALARCAEFEKEIQRPVMPFWPDGQ